MKKGTDSSHLLIIIFSLLLFADAVFIKNVSAFDQNKAVKQADTYIKYMAFSRDGLIKQLEFDGFSQSEAEYAADNCGADWNQQALKSAENYLKYMSFSKNGLIKQLKFDGYSQTEAEYAANNCGADWNQQAAKSAANYLNYMSFSQEKLISQLEFDGFTHEEALFGANSNNIDETDQAVSSAKNYLQYMAFSKTGLIKQLEFDGYPHEISSTAVESLSVDWKNQALKKAESYKTFMSLSEAQLVNQLEFDGFTHEEALFGAGIQVNESTTDSTNTAVADLHESTSQIPTQTPEPTPTNIAQQIATVQPEIENTEDNENEPRQCTIPEFIPQNVTLESCIEPDDDEVEKALILGIFSLLSDVDFDQESIILENYYGYSTDENITEENLSKMIENQYLHCDYGKGFTRVQPYPRSYEASEDFIVKIYELSDGTNYIQNIIYHDNDMWTGAILFYTASGDVRLKNQ